MHQIIFYPVGHGDTSQIILENGKRILFDYRHLKKTEEGEGPEINLKERLKSELKEKGKKAFDVVAFTHGHKDHIENSTEFFQLLHAEKYQGDQRVKIDQLWVPAAMILETASNDEQSEEFVIWRQEARHRLKEGKGIRVFSKPEKLKDWLEDNDLTLESRRHLIVDAGQLVDTFSLEEDGIEFFCHSPFIKHVDDGEQLRNEASLIFNVRLKIESNSFDYLAIGDTDWEVLEEIVQKSIKHGNKDRLEWDIYYIPHHCSYKALSDAKGEKETVPKKLIKELLLYGKTGAYMVNSSNPVEDSEEVRKQEYPPHIQAKKCYEKYLKEIDGVKVFTTMEEPNTDKPEPLIFNIDSNGISRSRKAISPVASIIISNPTPRAG